ncbi:DUF2213 domain-containing protein [Ahrensia marina]|uniref:DUF2213 domain-containing protein n=1 Tax=Ahrensia marina TaxID=1514904 RepID=UPI0035CF6062
MRFTDTAPLGATRISRDGYLLAEAACARTGCQVYLGKELGAEAGFEDENAITVYRPEEAVFNQDSLATYAGKPVTIGHPSEDVTAENWKDHAVGEVADEIVRDGQTVRVAFMVRDAAAIKAVEAGTREISMGYSTNIEKREGVAPDGTPYQAVQTGPITINHLALVDRARGGSELRIGDSAGKWGAAPITMSDIKEKTMSDALKTVVLGDKAVKVDASDIAAIEAFKTSQAKALADAETAHKAAIDAKDKEIATKDAKIEELEKSKLSDNDLDARVEARASLLDAARKIAKDVKTDGVADTDIRKAVVSAKLGDAAVKDRSDAYIEARFDVLAEDVSKSDPVADALSQPSKQKLNDGWGDVVPMRKEA